jgi:hypothetical protein
MIFFLEIVIKVLFLRKRWSEMELCGIVPGPEYDLQSVVSGQIRGSGWFAIQ